MPAFPHTTCKSHGAFEPGNTGLDPCSEISKTMIHIFAAAHIGFFKSALFGKTDILDIARSRLGLFQIIFGCKTTVKTDLERIAAIDFLLPVQHRDGQIDIGRIAFYNQAIQNQVGSPAGQADLVAENRIPAVLDNDVGVRLKDRYHLVSGRNFLAHHNPSMGLVDNFPGKPGVVLDIGQKGNAARYYNAVFDHFGSGACLAEHLAGNFEQIDIFGFAFLFILGIKKSQHPAFGPSVVVAELRNLDPEFIPAALNKPGQHPYAVAQQGRIPY